jgi:hypothetical protein
MARFTARPVTVEAYQYQGNTLNLEDAFNRAILRFRPGGQASVSYLGAAVTIDPGDWLVRGGDGVVEPVKRAKFEARFEPVTEVQLAPDKRKLRNVG